MAKFSYIWILCLLFSGTRACNRAPQETEAQQTEGSNGFHIEIYEYPANRSAPVLEGYIPGEKYTVTIEGFKTRYTEQTFRGFSLVAVSNEDSNEPLGEFLELGGNSEAQESSTCKHAVIHSSLYPKTIVEMTWQAPLYSGGCVDFKAMVLEYRDIWYMDEGPLTRRFCEIVGYAEQSGQASPDEECCACDEAKYELQFHGIWSRETHPRDFPRIEQLTHFSDLIGASHSKEYVMWDYGQVSSDGMKELAEWGNTIGMEHELKKQGREIRTIIKGKGLWYPNVRGTARAVFRVDRYHNLFSLASMFGPSPDWVVGVTKQNLCRKDCSWIDELEFNLQPFDAGTDGGKTYMSPNSPIEPRQPIKPITAKEPMGSPFYEEDSHEIPALAKLTIRRTKVYELECRNISYYMSQSVNKGGAATSEDLVYKDRPECSVGSWSSWTQCSATCGKGIRMRSRAYKRAFKAQLGGCARQMIEKQFCNSLIPECRDSDAFNEACSVTSWSAWTACSVSCGKGVRSRSRQYENQMATKICRLELKDKEKCTGPAGADCSIEPDPRCRSTLWSKWSPCSVSCGQGTRVRTRLLFDRQHMEICGEQSLLAKERCTAEFADCAAVIYRHKEEICVEPLLPGECDGVFPRYYYDAALEKCRRFIFTGCKGNRNNFESKEQCKRACITGPLDEEKPVPVDHLLGLIGSESGDDGLPVDCIMTEWSEWGECSKTCGRAKKQRTRMIQLSPKNNGQPCPVNTKETMSCRLRPCHRLKQHRKHLRRHQKQHNKFPFKSSQGQPKILLTSLTMSKAYRSSSALTLLIALLFTLTGWSFTD